MRKRHFVSYITYFIARLAPAASSFAIAIFLTRSIGAEGYGTYSMLFSLTLSGAAFFFGWINQGIARFSGDESANGPGSYRFRTAAVYASVISAVLCLLVFIVGNEQRIWLFSALTISLQGCHSCVLAMLQAKSHARQFALMEIVRAFLILVVPLGFSQIFGRDWTWPAYGLVVALLVNVAAAIVISKTIGLFDSGDAAGPARRVGEVFKYGWAISIWLAISMATPFLERAMVLRLAGDYAMGIYAYSYDIVFRAFTFLLLPITVYIQPRVFRIYSSGESSSKLIAVVRSAILVQVTIGVVGSLAYWLLTKTLLKSVLPVSVPTALFIPLASSAILWQICLLAHKFLECQKRIPEMLVTLIIVVGIVQMPMALFLYPLLGLKSFPVASAVGAILYCTLVFYRGMNRIILQ